MTDSTVSDAMDRAQIQQIRRFQHLILQVKKLNEHLASNPELSRRFSSDYPTLYAVMLPFFQAADEVWQLDETIRMLESPDTDKPVSDVIPPGLK